MSAISDSVFEPTANYETRWDGIFIVSSGSGSLAPFRGWRPAMNAYRCADQFVIFVELAGVPADSIEVRAQPGRVTVRGQRPDPEPASLRTEPAQMLALEIDQGTFERTLDLPQGIDPRGVTTEYSNGLLQIRLPFLT